MDIVGLLVSIVVWGLVFYLLWWALGKIALPEPFNKVATVVIVLFAVIVLLNLLGVVGTPLRVRWS